MPMSGISIPWTHAYNLQRLACVLLKSFALFIVGTLAVISLSYIYPPAHSSMRLSTLAPVLAATSTLFTTPSLAVDQDTNATQAFEFLTANTHLDRLRLASDCDLKYDFTTNSHYALLPGSVCTANAATFPFLTGLGMSVAQLNLAPCSMLPPHLHRSTNLVVAVSGTTHTWMIQENGARVVRQVLSSGQMTIFPQASVHAMVNEECQQAQLYSFLGGEDAGTLNVVNQLFSLPREVLGVVMPFLQQRGMMGQGGWNESVSMIPGIGTGSNGGSEACLARCGLNGTSSAGAGGGGRYRAIR